MTGPIAEHVEKVHMDLCVWEEVDGWVNRSTVRSMKRWWGVGPDCAHRPSTGLVHYLEHLCRFESLRFEQGEKRIIKMVVLICRLVRRNLEWSGLMINRVEELVCYNWFSDEQGISKHLELVGFQLWWFEFFTFLLVTEKTSNLFVLMIMFGLVWLGAKIRM